MPFSVPNRDLGRQQQARSLYESSYLTTPMYCHRLKISARIFAQTMRNPREDSTCGVTPRRSMIGGLW